MLNKKIFTRTIWILSIISLLTDISSEMLYPIMPIYLKSIGFSVLLIGILEGFAEAVSGLSKGYFGKMSDALGKRMPFVRLGYLLSAISKPMMGVFIYPIWIFVARSLDRLGKGIRTSARDAILSDETTPENKGKVFGFHRGMDTLGAVIGPLLALIYLSIYPDNYRILFIIAFIPGSLAVFFAYLIKDKPVAVKSQEQKLNFFSFLSYWKMSSVEYKKLMVALLIFSLLNSSDFFLLLMLKNLGFSDERIIWIYIFYNLIYAIAALPIGMLADKIGLKNNFIIGLIIFAFVYGSMATNPGIEFIFFIFLCYGIFAASTEGISKAWITNISDNKDTATAIGFYTSLNSICSLIASAFAGWLWYNYNPDTMFIFSAVGTLLIILYLIIVFRRKNIIYSKLVLI